MSQKKMKLSCPVCQSDAVEKYHDQVWSAPHAKVFHCLHCRTGFLHPMMTEDQEKAFYAAYNQHTQKRGVTLTKDSEELHARSRGDAELRWERLKPYFKDGSRVLEVGAATGAFLEICSKTCPSACVEPDKGNREYASRFSTRTYDYIEDIDESERFDIICLFHVFEHIRDPFPFLGTCGALLNEGGLVIIEVPHIQDPLLSVYESDAYKDFYFQPMHHFIYSETGLRAAFETSGFSEEKVIYVQRYGLANHLTWITHGKPGGDPVLQSLFSDADKVYRRDLENAGKTDTLMYIASKCTEKI